MFATTLSALYGKLLIVMGIAFPMAEVISSYIPPSFYEVFYTQFAAFINDCHWFDNIFVPFFEKEITDFELNGFFKKTNGEMY